MEQKTRPKRPRREKKSDRLIYPGASARDIRVDYAVAPFDRMANEMDRLWGADRLVELVPPEMAEKFGSAMAKLNEAIDSGEVEQVTLRVGVCMRGLQAMDQAARNSGAQPATDEVWLVAADGRQYGLLRDARAWQRAQEKHPGVELVSEREIVLALEMYKRSVTGRTIDAVKSSFPGAEVVEIRDQDLQDEIPW